jgi:hypothetical protein
MTAIITRTDALSTDNGSSSVKGSTLTHTELDRNFYPIKLATDGTVEAGKAIIVDSNKDFTGVRSGTFTGTVTAEQITSTDDMTVTDDLTVGGNLTVTGNISNSGLPLAFQSGELSLSTTAQTTAHGLGVVPNAFHVVLVCKTTDLGYSVGDRVAVNPSINDNDQGSGTSTNGFAIGANSSSVFYRVSGSTSSICIGSKTSGDPANITASRWRLVVTALYYS